jgi:hypothetical protein
MRAAVGLFLLAGLLAGAPLSSHGQDLQYGIALGANRVTMQVPGADPGGYFAFAGGLVVRQPLFGPVSIQPELLLNQKGAEIESEGGGSIEYGVGYLELPVLIHLEAPSVRSVTVHGEAGGFGAVKLFERQTPGENRTVSFDADASFFRRYNAGVVAGVGATLPIREQRLNLTVRRAWGLMDVAQDVADQPFPEAAFPADGETRTWSLLLRLGF